MSGHRGGCGEVSRCNTTGESWGNYISAQKKRSNEIQEKAWVAPQERTYMGPKMYEKLTHRNSIVEYFKTPIHADSFHFVPKTNPCSHLKRLFCNSKAIMCNFTRVNEWTRTVYYSSKEKTIPWFLESAHRETLVSDDGKFTASVCNGKQSRTITTEYSRGREQLGKSTLIYHRRL